MILPIWFFLSIYSLMGRRKTINNEQILDSARTLFLRQGFQTSTSAIAKHAGVSEGTIFNRFPTKDALFHAAMNLPEIDISAVVKKHLENADARQGLSELVRELLDYFREFVPRMMMLTFSNPGGQGMLAFKDHKRMHATRILAGIADYFRHEVEAKRIQVCNPEICARMILGSILNFVISGRIGIVLDEPLNPDHFIQQLVNVLWTGIGHKE